MTVDDLAALLAQAEGADDGARFGLANQLRAHPGLAGATGEQALEAAALLADAGALPDLPQAAALAQRAHDEGIEGAGVLYAMCTDKLALYSGRPQPFGTVSVEHQGDIVQPPVDPSTSDEDRIALGVLPLRLLRAEAEKASRELAIRRAATPGDLPPGQTFCRVWTDPDPTELRARLATEGAPAWADGDVITFVTEHPGPVAVTPVFPLPSWDAGDGLQVLSLRVDRLDEAVITYTFTPLDGPGAAMSFSRGSHDGRYRGPAAPPELPSNDPLVGSTFDHGLESMALGENRRITVYRPPDHQIGEDIPVVYATDGNMFSPYARRLDAAIVAGRCPRVVMVAAHAAPADHLRGNQRALEYLMGFDDARYDAHQRFFVDELSTWAEAELGVPSDRERKAVFGCSDGGGHALSTGRLHHNRFGHLFAFSTGTPPEPTVTWDDNHPFVHLCAGTLESGFHQATAAWAGFLHQLGAPYHFTERVSGHDLIQWCEELPVALDRAWSQA